MQKTLFHRTDPSVGPTPLQKEEDREELEEMYKELSENFEPENDENSGDGNGGE